MDQKKKLVVGGAVAVFVMFIFYFSLRSTNILAEEEPKFDIKDLTNIAPEDGKVLVAFQGYAKYLSPDYGKKVYLSLTPVTGVNDIDASETLPGVAFKSANAILSATFLQNEAKIQAHKISLATNDGDADKSCVVEDASITYSKDSYYECDTAKIYPCMGVRKDKDGKDAAIKVAELTISAIRLEVNGDASDHKSGKFTFKPEKCT